MRERSSITPMKMKERDGEQHVVGHHPEHALRKRAEETDRSNNPSRWPSTAKASETPPSVKATG